MDIKKVTTYMSQTEAATLAVLASHVRRNMQTDRELTPDEEEVNNFLCDVEEAALESIKFNDSNVVHWIGIAAKQMNPLLS